jgi:tripartite-type tricarboxylate transporter receptor subunit TctC
MIRNTFLIVALCAGLGHAVGSMAQDYPTKPVRWVVPYAAGGPTDTLVRLVTQKISEGWGERIVVDLRPGANSIIGTEIVARAQPDGYTMLVALPALAINPSVYPKLPYDTLRELAPVTLIGTAAYVVVVNASLPVKSISDLVALAKSRPGQLSYGSGGIASPAHLSIELLQQQTGVRMVHVPYKGGAPALVDLVSGRIQLMANPISSSMAFIKGGKLRPIAVTSSSRTRTLPEVPTISEAGLGSYHVNTWYGLFAPAKTPPAIVQFVANSVSKSLRDPGVAKRLAEFDVEPAGNSPQEFSRFVRDEVKRWGEVVEKANITIGAQ